MVDCLSHIKASFVKKDFLKIDFKINNESIVLRMGDVFEIPINVEHEVVGRDIENIFLIVKELDANP